MVGVDGMIVVSLVLEEGIGSCGRVVRNIFWGVYKCLREFLGG